MSKTIEQMLDELYEKEGGYTNHPADRGGPTNKGITEQVARAYGYSGDMKAIPEAIVKEIYKQLYWKRPGFDKINQGMPKVAEELFDTGVNMGPKVAAVMLQRCLNVLNRGGNDYPDIKADGDIGPMTLSVLARLANYRGTFEAEKMLVKALNVLQGCRYISIAEANPSQEAFEWGWLANRVELN